MIHCVKYFFFYISGFYQHLSTQAAQSISVHQCFGSMSNIFLTEYLQWFVSRLRSRFLADNYVLETFGISSCGFYQQVDHFKSVLTPEVIFVITAKRHIRRPSSLIYIYINIQTSWIIHKHKYFGVKCVCSSWWLTTCI